MEKSQSIQSPDRFSAGQLAAQAASIGRRTTLATFGEGSNEQAYTILKQPLLKPEPQVQMPPRLPKRMILPGLRTS